MPAKKRNYRKEYDNYQGTAEQKKRRASRNAARAVMVKSGKAKKGDGKDVAHKNGNLKIIRHPTLRHRLSLRTGHMPELRLQVRRTLSPNIEKPT